MADDELVEAVAMQLCRAGGYGLCVGFCHARRCAEAIENYGHVARAIIPLVQQAERARIVVWLRDCTLSSAIPDDPMQIIDDLADAIERGEHTQESQ